MARKKNPGIPVFRVSLPFTLQTFISSKDMEGMPDKDKRKDFKKFFIERVKWSLDYYLESEDDEILTRMGMPRIEDIFDYE